MSKNKENVYGLLIWCKEAPKSYKPCANARKAFDSLIEQNARGVYVLSGPKIDTRTRSLSILCRKAGLDFILGFPYIPAKAKARQHIEHQEDPKFSHDVSDIYQALKLTNKLALGNGETGEWYGGALAAQDYIEDAKRLGYEWVCSLSMHSLLRDLCYRDLRYILAKTQCFTLCGHMLIGFLSENYEIPNWVIWAAKKHAYFGDLTVPRLMAWLEDRDVWSGAGFQRGLDAGVRPSADDFGFSGILVGMPFCL